MSKATFSISLEGAPELMRDLEKFKDLAGKAVKRAVDKTAIAVESDAKERLKGELGGDKRIDTNRLRASVHAEFGENTEESEKNTFEPVKASQGSDKDLSVEIASDEAVVGTNVEYGGFIEFGTKFIEEMSYLGFAAVNQTKKFAGRVENELNKLLSKQ